MMAIVIAFVATPISGQEEVGDFMYTPVMFTRTSPVKPWN